MKLGTSGRNAAATAIIALLNGGRIEIRTGSAPTNVGDASSGTLLGTLTLSNPAGGSPSTGTITYNSITSATAVASGDAGYFRAYASGGTDTQAVYQGSVGEAGDSPELVLDEKTVVSGGTIAISSLTFTVSI